MKVPFSPAGGRFPALAAGLAFVLLLACAPPPSDAGEKGQLEGTVMTCGGTPLLGAVISVVDRFLPGIKLFTVSDRRGRFHFDGLRPGEYILSAAAQGFVTLKVKSVRVFGGQRLSTHLDLKHLNPEDGRKEMVVDSLDDLKWYLRSATRDVLNREHGALPGHEQKAAFPSPLNILDSKLNGRIEMSASASAGDEGRDSLGTVRKSTKVDLSGGLGQATSWDLSARMMDHTGPAYAAEGRVNCDIIKNHAFQMEAAYFSMSNEKTFAPEGLKESTADWRSGRIYAEDAWSLFKPLILACGVRFNHYDYLSDSDYLSPKVAVWYLPAKNTSISGSVSYEAEALREEDFFYYGSADSVSGREALEAERGIRCAVTLEQRFKGASMVKITAFFHGASDKIAGYYTGPSGSSGSGGERFVVFNLGNTETRGVSLELSRRLKPYLKGTVGYQIRKASFSDGNELLIGYDIGNTLMPFDHTMQDITASAEADIARTATTVATIVRMNTGYPLIGDHSGPLPLSRTVDFKLRQKLPVMSLPDSDVEAVLEIANLLNTTFPQVVTFNGDRSVGLPRRITGGISLVF